MRTLFTTAAVALGLLCATATPAFAAKGVKKNAVNGAHHVQGVVTHVRHHKGKNAAGHIGEITVKVHHHKKKGQPAVAGKKIANHTHKFTVGKTTRVTMMHKKQHAAASFVSLHAGEHVTVTAKGTHAEAVAIHTHTKKK